MIKRKKDKRVGNFTIHKEPLHLKFSDLYGLVTHRVSTLIPKGRFLEMGIEQGQDAFLEAYCTVMHNVLSCVPDSDFLSELNKAAAECAERHKDLYNIKEDIDKKEDDAILEGQKELNEELEGEK